VRVGGAAACSWVGVMEGVRAGVRHDGPQLGQRRRQRLRAGEGRHHCPQLGEGGGVSAGWWGATRRPAAKWGRWSECGRVEVRHDCPKLGQRRRQRLWAGPAGACGVGARWGVESGEVGAVGGAVWGAGPVRRPAVGGVIRANVAIGSPSPLLHRLGWTMRSRPGSSGIAPPVYVRQPSRSFTIDLVGRTAHLSRSKSRTRSVVGGPMAHAGMVVGPSTSPPTSGPAVSSACAQPISAVIQLHGVAAFAQPHCVTIAPRRHRPAGCTWHHPHPRVLGPVTSLGGVGRLGAWI